jgi:hypothetical protein
MPRVIAPRSFRPRLLLLPLLFGLLMLPALLRTTTAPAAEEGLHSGSVCSNLEEAKARPLPEKESKAICAHCRGPMLDVPLAHVNDPTSDGVAPPAA